MSFRGAFDFGLASAGGRFRLTFGLAVASLTVTGIAAGPALAKTKSFTSPGCSVWTVPVGVSGLSIQATGSAGQAVNGGLGPGGSGDVVSGTLSGLSSGQVLDVCVNSGGAAGGNSGAPGGAGGGASGVALGSDFSVPVLIAGGGGGGAGAEMHGGNAGLPNGGHGDSNAAGGTGGGGGNNTTMTVGDGGAADSACSECTAGVNGAASSSAGPGAGGAGGAGDLPGGGGGGAGYFGGGGGGGAFTSAGGGGGGSDFCASSLPAPVSLGGCEMTGTNSTYGTASVALTYTQAAWVHDFRDLLVDSRGVGPGETLVHKDKLARSKYLASDVSGSCRTLDGFVREVNKQTGTTITQAQARELIEDAHETQKAIGCSKSP